LLRKNAKHTQSEGVRNSYVFCVERKCVIEEEFCRYVCPKTQDCPLWHDEYEIFRQRSQPIYYDQRSSRVAHTLKQHTPNTLTPQQHSVNFISNQFLETASTSVHQFNDLRKAPGIGHVEGYKWPECECPACCSELLINLMQETYSFQQKTQHSSHTHTARTNTRMLEQGT
jgi:hypothetical protein